MALPLSCTPGWAYKALAPAPHLLCSHTFAHHLWVHPSLRPEAFLLHPYCKTQVVAVYLKKSWWSTEDVLRTADPTREGLMKVQSFGERIVLFILNVIIFGRLERNLDDDDMFFLPHSVKEQAKILWKNGAAVGFYTTKLKGSLCGDGTSACYLLPVFDTVFVRRIHRRQGLGTAMLRDFCETFQGEEALGFSRPISPAMFQEATEDSRSWGEGRRHPALLKFSLSLLRDPPAGSLSKSAGNSCWPVQRSGDACGKWSPRGPGISASTSGSRFSCSRQEFRMEQSVGGEVRNGKSDQDHGEKEEGPGLPVRPR
ncbi:protein FAM169B isoform X3 [Cavia porcellus]|uniref:protein FAM169B isoform X3 n=1 Tax=Cavia porcellus TaxID=10141 RepID=UPI002FE35A2E